VPRAIVWRQMYCPSKKGICDQPGMRLLAQGTDAQRCCSEWLCQEQKHPLVLQSKHAGSGRWRLSTDRSTADPSMAFRSFLHGWRNENFGGTDEQFREPVTKYRAGRLNSFSIITYPCTRRRRTLVRPEGMSQPNRPLAKIFYSSMVL
jgi:hypothetical protein